MKENHWEEEIDTVKIIENLKDRTTSLQKRMNLFYYHRKELLSRYHSINRLDNRFKKQVTEILYFFNRHKGKDYDFLHDELYDLTCTKLIESTIKIDKARGANGGSNQLTSGHLLEEKELYVKIEEMASNREKMLTLREEFFTQEEAANARIGELLKFIRK